MAAQKKKFVSPLFLLFFHLLRFLVFFNSLFAPTSRSRMSNILRDSESLEKSNGKKWSQIWTFLFENWDSESLGKSNGKKWSNIWIFLFGSGLKSPRKKKFFLLLILPWSTLLWHRCYQRHRPIQSIGRYVRPSFHLYVCPSVCSLLRYRLNVFLFPLPEVGCPILLEIWNPWGKVMERSGLKFEHFCLKIV